MISGIRPLATVLGFDAAVTELVVWIARAYTLGLVSYAIIEVTARAFYAQQNARTPLITIFLTAGAFILMAIPLANWLGAPGIALANSLAFTIQLMIMIHLLRKQFPAIVNVKETLVRVIPASIGACLIVILITSLIPFSTLNTILGAALAAGGMALSGFLALPFLWPEIKLLVKL